MNDLARNILKLMGVLFALLVLGFTGFQTWSLLYEVSYNPIVATIGLVLFEGGMLYWWYAFQKDAEGTGQLAVSLLMAIFGLLLVAGATALHLGAVDGNTLGMNTPARLVTVAAIVNLFGKFLFPLLEPNTFNEIWNKALEGKITRQAYRDADSKVNDMAAELADTIGAEITRRARVRVLTDFGLHHEGEGLGLPQPVSHSIPGEAEEVVTFPLDGAAVMAAETRPMRAKVEPAGFGENGENFQ